MNTKDITAVYKHWYCIEWLLSGFDNYHKIAVRDHVYLPKFWHTWRTCANTNKHTSGVITPRIYFKKHFVWTACKALFFSYFYRPWQIKFSVMYAHVLVFLMISSLTYFQIKIFVRVKQKISSLNSSWIQTILVVNSIRWLYH